MRILVLDTYYEKFLDSLYAERAGLHGLPYRDQWRLLMDECFGTADFYSKNLTALGHIAEEVVVNCKPLQEQWAREYAPSMFASGGKAGKGWAQRVVLEQVRVLSPDVVYVQDMTWLDPVLLEGIRQSGCLLLGQTAYALDWSFPFGLYDLVLSSLPNYVQRFRAADVRADYFRLGFEPAILQRLPHAARNLPAVFVGGLSSAHSSSLGVLDAVARSLPAEFYGYGGERLPPDSPVRARHHGAVWGLGMYEILARAQIVLNRHADFAGPFANNMRLYEATGVGSCLVTDAKDNLADQFDVGAEVVAYSGVEDCVEKIRYLLEHEEERAAIAEAGQRRTLRDHTYRRRMEQLVGLIEGLPRPAAAAARSAPRAQSPASAAPLAGAPARVSAWAERAARRTAAAVPLPPWAHRAGRKALGVLRSATSSAADVSADYVVVDPTTVGENGGYDGWRDPGVADRQDAAYQALLNDMYAGNVRRDLEVAAQAIARTGLDDPLLLEVGCGSGYYSEILTHLLGHPLRYVGLDYSSAMVTRARQRYRRRCFVEGDATRLPFGDATCDIVFNGAALMHIPDYAAAVAEAARVARRWCVFHTVTIRRDGPTTLLEKKAYGGRTLEVVFNQDELEALFADRTLSIRETFASVDYDLAVVIGEATSTRTYLCEVARP